MKSFTKIVYKDIIRWDLITQFEIQSAYQIPSIKQVSLRMHESHPKQYKDRFVLALFLELISGQRVANRLILKGRYKKSLTVKHSSDAIQLAVSLRGTSAYQFIDKWVLYGIPKSNMLSQYKTLSASSRGTLSFYYPELITFPETQKLFPTVHKIGGVQIHLVSNIASNAYLLYILASLRIPTEAEGSVDNGNAVYSFFNKTT